MKKVSINQSINLSEHFTLGEVTKSRHEEIYNIPSHVAIENLKRVCEWLEELRRRYNQRYVLRSVSPPKLGGVRGGLNRGLSGASSDHPNPSSLGFAALLCKELRKGSLRQDSPPEFLRPFGSKRQAERGEPEGV